MTQHGAALGPILLGLLTLQCVSQAGADDPAEPLPIGETFKVDSAVLGEARRINVYLPPAYQATPDARLPVLYLLDGGMAEDFLHMAGLVQVSTANATMRPFLLVGIENTDRRRDLTGPTTNQEDRRISPRVGGAESFRRFIRQELMPAVARRYRTTPESAIVGESLAGLFVVETLLLEPELFDSYIAVDPSLWWNEQALIRSAEARLRERPNLEKTFYLASSGEVGLSNQAERLAEIMRKNAPPKLRWHHEKMPEEQHATIFQPAALKAFRTVFDPKEIHQKNSTND